MMLFLLIMATPVLALMAIVHIASGQWANAIVEWLLISWAWTLVEVKLGEAKK